MIAANAGLLILGYFVFSKGTITLPCFLFVCFVFSKKPCLPIHPDPPTRHPRRQAGIQVAAQAAP